jgi:hypothetical protein
MFYPRIRTKGEAMLKTFHIDIHTVPGAAGFVYTLAGRLVR